MLDSVTYRGMCSRTTSVHSSQQFVCMVFAFCTHRRPVPQSLSQRQSIGTHESGSAQIGLSFPI